MSPRNPFWHPSRGPQPDESPTASTVPSDFDVSADDLHAELVSSIAFEPADCCSARGAFRVVLPPTASRPQPAELIFCGHHYRACATALTSSEAWVYDVTDHLVASSTPAPL